MNNFISSPRQLQPNAGEWKLWIGDGTPIAGAFGACSIVRDLNMYINFAPDTETDFQESWIQMMKREPRQLFFFAFRDEDFNVVTNNNVNTYSGNFQNVDVSSVPGKVIVRDLSGSENHLEIAVDSAGSFFQSTGSLLFAAEDNGAPPGYFKLP